MMSAVSASKAGFQDSDDYIVLTAEGIETYGSGCRFAQQLTSVPGTQSLECDLFRRGRGGDDGSKPSWSPTRARVVSS